MAELDTHSQLKDHLLRSFIGKSHMTSLYNSSYCRLPTSALFLRRNLSLLSSYQMQTPGSLPPSSRIHPGPCMLRHAAFQRPDHGGPSKHELPHRTPLLCDFSGSLLLQGKKSRDFDGIKSIPTDPCLLPINPLTSIYFKDHETRWNPLRHFSKPLGVFSM